MAGLSPLGPGGAPEYASEPLNLGSTRQLCMSDRVGRLETGKQAPMTAGRGLGPLGEGGLIADPNSVEWFPWQPYIGLWDRTA